VRYFEQARAKARVSIQLIKRKLRSKMIRRGVIRKMSRQPTYSDSMGNNYALRGNTVYGFYRGEYCEHPVVQRLQGGRIVLVQTARGRKRLQRRSHYMRDRDYMSDG